MLSDGTLINVYLIFLLNFKLLTFQVKVKTNWQHHIDIVHKQMLDVPPLGKDNLLNK